jgi:hypothetical protein
MSIAKSSPTARHLLFDAQNNLPYTARLENNTLYIRDVFDDTLLNNIFEKYGRPRYVFSDSLSCYRSDLDIDVYAINYWLEQEVEKKLCRCHLPRVENIQTNFSANFLINKKQINRYLTIKLCEIFGVRCNYTWSGIGTEFDLSHILDENKYLNDPRISQMFSNLLTPVKIFEKKWVDSGSSGSINESSVINYGSTEEVWNRGLDQVVSSTAVSLVTESVWTQTAAVFSEKTAYSVLGLTFPLWIGGFNQAQEWHNKGFDIFDDVIDHSYQNRPTLLERCFYAFDLNKDILTDRDLAHDRTMACADRLVANRERLLSDCLEKYNRGVIESWPWDLRDQVLSVMKKPGH